MMSSEDCSIKISSCDFLDPEPQPKKRKTSCWAQRFNPSWHSVFPWAQESTRNERSAYCVVCSKTLRCKKDDLAKHSRSVIHRLNMQRQPPLAEDGTESICIFSETLENRPVELLSPGGISKLVCGVDVSPELQLAKTTLLKTVDALNGLIAQHGDSSLIVESINLIVEMLEQIRLFPS